GHSAQVTSLRGPKNVEHGLSVVVGHGSHSHATRYASEVPKHLPRRAAGAVHGNIFEILQGCKVILGRLSRDVVADSRFWIQPEGGRCLKAPAERNQEIPSHLALRDAR